MLDTIHIFYGHQTHYDQINMVKHESKDEKDVEKKLMIFFLSLSCGSYMYRR